MGGELYRQAMMRLVKDQIPLADLERAFEGGDRDPEALIRLGDALRRAQRFSEAERAYCMALAWGALPRRAQFKIGKARAERMQAALPPKLRIPPGDGTARSPARAELESMATAVKRELARSPAVTPSLFWEEHAELHFELLARYGLDNFKRTLAHNYYNWLTLDFADPQIQRLFDLWPVHGSQEPFTDFLEKPGSVGMPTHGSQGNYALDDPGWRRVYQLGASLLWDTTLAQDRHGILCDLAEPLTGNPLRLWRGDRLIAQDLAHSVRERNTIVDTAGLDVASPRPLVIGELGAGNGRLAHVFAMTTNARYLIFDIAPALLVSQWYVSSLFPNERIFKFRPFERFEQVAQEVDGARFAFFSANQLELLPERYFDVFINVCSLMEMRLDSIAHYFRQIDRLTRGVFYTKQWWVQENRQDGIVVRKEDYPVPPHWRQLLEQEDAILPRLFEQLWRVAPA
jgi:putative sugar O-methyltransferase